VRAVLDPNVLIAAVLSPRGAPAQVLRRWLDGAFELVVSEGLLAELGRAFTYPKLRSRIGKEEAAGVLALLRSSAIFVPDPPRPEPRPPDPGDDYLLPLAEAGNAILVTGDKHLLRLRKLPIRAPRAFLAQLDE
jgi:putative PIN family toxin of toxin-antitoxin system